jgi:charged multivesicular body protein 3
MSFFFGGKSSSTSTSKTGKEASKERVKQWNRTLQHKVRELDKQILEIQRAEAKAQISAKKAVKDGQLASAQILAREIVRSRNETMKLQIAKSNMNSIIMNLSSQETMSRLISGMKGATTILAQMNQLMHIEQLRDTVRDMSKEMAKADLISEAVDEGFESVFTEVESEDAVQNVLAEILASPKQQSRVVVPSEQPSAAQRTADVKVPAPEAEEQDEPDVEIDLSQMQARFAALRASAT